jgi:hypothetical protein
MHYTPIFTARKVRNGLLEWFDALDLPHALTLNTDRSLTLPRLRSILSRFCLNVDRVCHGRKNVQGVPTADRFLCVAFPEHLETNAHVHALANLHPFISCFPNAKAATGYLEYIWRQSTRGAGSVFVEEAHNDGFGRYASKGVIAADAPYFLSSDYHRQP